MKPSQLYAVFKSLKLEKQFASATNAIKHMVEGLGDPEVTFEQFITHINQYYDQRNSPEGLRRIFSLYDQRGKGVLTRQDFERLNIEMELGFQQWHIEELFEKASDDGVKITAHKFEVFMFRNF